MDERLEGSLQEFDGMLIREREALAQGRSSGAGGVSGDGGSTDGEQGDGVSGQASGGQVTGEPAGSELGEQQQVQAEGGAAETGEAAEQSRPGARTVPSGGSGRATPADIPDGSDDDIVARQLREAAEKEQDPELRARLWEEYRRYKLGQSGRAVEPTDKEE